MILSCPDARGAKIESKVDALADQVANRYLLEKETTEMHLQQERRVSLAHTVKGIIQAVYEIKKLRKTIFLRSVPRKGTSNWTVGCRSDD